MSSDGTDGRLDDETIETLLAAGPDVRFYLSKVVSLEPFDRVVESWKAERPDEFREVVADDAVEPVLNLSAPGEFVRTYTDETLTPVEQRYVDDLREAVYEEVREARRRLSLSPTEFSVYLLSQAAGMSEEAVGAELDLPVEDVRANLEDAREKFRTAMCMIDLCERFDDPELVEDLEAWRIHRDPVFEG